MLIHMLLRTIGLLGMGLCAFSLAAQAKAGQLRGWKLYVGAAGVVLAVVGIIMSAAGI